MNEKILGFLGKLFRGLCVAGLAAGAMLLCAFAALFFAVKTGVLENAPSASHAKLEDFIPELEKSGFKSFAEAGLLHESRSKRAMFNGDHVDAFEIALPGSRAEFLVSPPKGWTRCDALSNEEESVLKAACSWLSGERLDWFRSADVFKSSRFFLKILSLRLNDGSPTDMRVAVYDVELERVELFDIES